MNNDKHIKRWVFGISFLFLGIVGYMLVSIIGVFANQNRTHPVDIRILEAEDVIESNSDWVVPILLRPFDSLYSEAMPTRLDQAHNYVDVAALKKVVDSPVASIAMYQHRHSPEQERLTIEMLEARGQGFGEVAFQPLSSVKYEFANGAILYISTTILPSEAYRDSTVPILGSEIISLTEDQIGYVSTEVVETSEAIVMNRIAYWDGDMIVAATGTIDVETMADVVAQIQNGGS
jgi:hypothetical protein